MTDSQIQELQELQFIASRKSVVTIKLDADLADQMDQCGMIALVADSPEFRDVFFTLETIPGMLIVEEESGHHAHFFLESVDMGNNILPNGCAFENEAGDVIEIVAI